MMPELRDQIDSRRGNLKKERDSFMPHWKDLSLNILPRRGRFLHTDVNKGDKRYSNIIDNTGMLAARTLQAGLMAWHTSPSRPWFKLGTPDPGLSEHGPVKEWLYEVERRLRYVFAKSNLYNVIPLSYQELGVFATGAFLLVDDTETFMRAYPCTIGEYMLGINEKGVADTFYRERPFTVNQMIGKFGRDKVSQTVKDLYDRGSVDAYVTVLHAIEPNDDRVPSIKNARNMPFRSVYYEDGDNSKEPLLQSGFEEFPVMAPRWHTNTGDAYGTQCPGMDALGDTKGLQIMQKRKAQAIDKMVNPPLTGPSTLKTQHISSLPGTMNYIDVMQGQQGLQPMLQININLGDLREDIRETQMRIEKAFYADLFLMMQSLDRRQITATEVMERHEEKLLVLGHVLERLNDEMLDPLIDRGFNILARNNLLPPPPRELQNKDLKVDYISLLSQAQQSVDTRSIQNLFSYVGAAAEINPEVIDKVDFDQGVDEIGERLGVPPALIRSDDDVAEIRQGRAARIAEQQRIESANQAAQGAKVLSETNLEGDNALTAITG